MEYLWIIFTLLSAFLLAFKDILSKKVLVKSNKPLQIIFEQYFLMFLVLSLLFYDLIDFNSIFVFWKLYLLKATSIFLFTYLYFILLKKFEISKFAPLMNASPIFLVLLSSIFLNESITFVQLVGIIIIIFATYLLEVNINFHFKDNPHRHHFDWFKKLDLKNISLVILMLIVISITAIADKKILGSGISVYTNMFYTSLLIFTFLSFYYIKNKNFLLVFKYIKSEPITFLISVISLISTFFVLLAISMPTTMVSLIVPLRRTSTLFAAILGGLLFHEKHLIKKLIAVIIMIFGISLIVL